MCFGLGWIENFLIWIIVVCGVIALLKLLMAFVFPRLGLAAETLAFVVQAITIVIWVIVCIAAVMFIFELISCLVPLRFAR